MSEYISIFLTSDENYAKYMAVTIQSIISNTKEKINFYILNSKCRKIKQFIFEKIKSNKTKKYKIFGLTIIKKSYKNNRCIFYFLGIPCFSFIKKNYKDK